MVCEKMDIENIEGAYLVPLNVHVDERGQFFELLRDGEKQFVQQNVSISRAGVLRGVHFQTESPQGKLVTCLQGTILDVIIDLRQDSPTFLETFATILSDEEPHSFYVPAGCGHSFLTLSDKAIVHYNCTSYYNKAHDAGVRWDSPELKPLYCLGSKQPIVSVKDRNLPTLAEYLKWRTSSW